MSESLDVKKTIPTTILNSVRAETCPATTYYVVK